MAVSMSSIPSASSVFAAYASISAFIMLVQTMLNQLIPRQLQHYVIKFIQYYFTPNPTKATIIIEERDGLSTNEVYNAAETYLCTKIRPNIERLKITKRPKDTNLSIKFAQCEKITDNFQGVPLEWHYVYELKKKSTKMIDQETDDIVVESERRCFELLFDKDHKNLVLEKYVPYILDQAKCLKEEKKVIVPFAMRLIYLLKNLSFHLTCKIPLSCS